MIKNEENQAVSTAPKYLSKTQMALALALSALVTSPAMANTEYPTIDFSSIPFGVWIAAVMAFALMCGMAYIGLSAMISVMRKARGAVR
ncbi:hypothetical protein [Acinetobacter haemolyticus]|uniref:hypothetical protein n=1 Tax=Acinetobacter haemolyticus TaxID=29430 RepID=UPI00137378E7|nr:hypothetical protein [Acinetobacter haemolyticus]NAS10259.1 hypothetical protein [Acinetobacter haemolyticus]